jgi:maltooligosyltrehalose trehalohydrolase
MGLGAEVLGGAAGVRFSVWATRARRMAVRLLGGGDHEMARTHPDSSVWSVVVPGAVPGSRYLFVIDGDGDRARPDPRSRFQPEGVHGPSEVVDPGRYPWRHPVPRRRVALADQVIYELHVGTFTPEGTYAAAAARFPALADLGVTAVELMPVNAFPGERNWGYDGVYAFAPCVAYGRPDELRALVDAAHAAGLEVILDVVYNHLGPEGNYLGEYAPYLVRGTLWGEGPDFSLPEVRAWAIDSAGAWLREYRVDGLRVDAIHAIHDESRPHVLAELTASARPGLMIAETDLNRTRVFDEWGFDACWSDDFHHALHAALTGERHGYYRDFGSVEILARAIQDGWIRGPEPGRSRDVAPERLVVSSQNHDQVGNRARGDRLEHLVGPAAARLAAVATLAAAPAVPLLFMGEETGAATPFLYFTSHGDPELARAVAEGRRREFAEFAWQGEVPDPQAPTSFARSRLRRDEGAAGDARLRLYRDLLALRRERPALGARAKAACKASARGRTVWVERGESLLVVLNLDEQEAVVVPDPWTPLLHAEDRRYGGALDAPGQTVPPRSAAVYRRR